MWILQEHTLLYFFSLLVVLKATSILFVDLELLAVYEDSSGLVAGLILGAVVKQLPRFLGWRLHLDAISLKI